MVLLTAYASSSTRAITCTCMAAPATNMTTCVLGATNQLIQNCSAQRAGQNLRPAQVMPRHERASCRSMSPMEGLSNPPLVALRHSHLSAYVTLCPVHCSHVFPLRQPISFIQLGASEPLHLQWVYPYYHNSLLNYMYSSVTTQCMS